MFMGPHKTLLSRQLKNKTLTSTLTFAVRYGQTVAEANVSLLTTRASLIAVQMFLFYCTFSMTIDEMNYTVLP